MDKQNKTCPRICDFHARRQCNSIVPEYFHHGRSNGHVNLAKHVHFISGNFYGIRLRTCFTNRDEFLEFSFSGLVVNGLSVADNFVCNLVMM